MRSRTARPSHRGCVLALWAQASRCPTPAGPTERSPLTAVGWSGEAHQVAAQASVVVVAAAPRVSAPLSVPVSEPVSAPVSVQELVQGCSALR